MMTTTTTTKTMTTTMQGRSICAERGGVDWVDGGVTKNQPTNLAYVVAFEENNNSDENEQWAVQPKQRLPGGGQESR